MRLWILKPIKDWEPWYDTALGFVVRAVDEATARQLASETAGDEGSAVWLDPSKTDCEELEQSGEEGIILCDFAAA